jgi:hypothetical protein
VLLATLALMPLGGVGAADCTHVRRGAMSRHASHPPASRAVPLAATSSGAAGPPPLGAAGPPPLGAAGPPPLGAAGPPPLGAAGPPPSGAAQPRVMVRAAPRCVGDGCADVAIPASDGEPMPFDADAQPMDGSPRD